MNPKQVVMPDREKTTEEFLERQVRWMDRLIENWKPRTAWDAANHRELKWYKRRRNKFEKALERLQNETKEKNKPR